jgi:diadenosine tetraphosphate (Ap4A) HIT family hydrolase
MTPTERLAQLANNENPGMIARLESGFAVMGDSQFLPGYCLLLAYPQVEKLNDLTGARRVQFLSDMARLGDAILAATNCLRVNYSIYGNLDPFLHAHLFPRYDWESTEHSTKPPMQIPSELREAEEHRFDPEKFGDLVSAIRNGL